MTIFSSFLFIVAGEKPVVQLDAPSACSGVFFHCELIGPDVLPKDEMKAKIKEFLFEQAQGEEKGLTACLIIHTLAKNQDAVCEPLFNKCG